jgi:Domain of unknown function (DUF1992)
MTRRKPPNVSFGDWVERQIVDAQRDGQFDELPGSGKPLADVGESADGMTWVAAKLRRENMDLAALLPPALALAKEVENLSSTLAALRSEAAVRAAVEDLNARIRYAHRVPHDGPPVRVMPLDIDEHVLRWRDREPPPAASQSPASRTPASRTPASQRPGAATPRRRLLPGLGRRRRSP